MQFSNLTQRLRQALREDGASHDITTRQLPGLAQKKVMAVVLAKENGILCGGVLGKPLFSLLDPVAQVRLLRKDGTRVRKGQKIAEISARARAVLGGSGPS